MLLNLSLVTQTLVNVLKKGIEASPAWPGSLTLSVSPLPPDRLKGDNTLGVYLYHLSEEAALKNQPDAGSSQPLIRFQPMGLNLFYVVTAHSDIESDDAAIHEQLIMGLAVKTLHDYPKLDDQTKINGSVVFPVLLSGENNRFRLSLHPLPPAEAVHYWTAGSQPMRLAAYYQVNIALLEPEENKSQAGRVLTYGTYPFLQGAPWLSGTRNTVGFTVPGESQLREVVLQPAQATYGQVFSLLGTDLTATSTSLVLQNPAWAAPLEVDAPWAVVGLANEVRATAQTKISAQDVLPGVYSGRVKVVDQRPQSDGTLKTFTKLSNAAVFTLAPKVAPLGVPGITGVLNITGAIFQHALLKPENVEVFITETKLKTGTWGALNPGEFAVAGPTSLQFRLPAGLVSGSLAPFRLIINGAESEPQWVKVP